MDTGVRTPLVDMFRRGNVEPELRMLAARGILAPRAHEQLALLAILVEDVDAAVATAARETIASIPEDALFGFLARGDVPNELRALFTTGRPATASTPSTSDGPLVDNSAEMTAEQAAEEEGSALQRISAMNVAQRLTLAMKGNREERTILVRDPNKIVSTAVLSSPKLTDTEVESIARMANVSEDVLRIISMNRAWMKNYQVALSLAKNPKTPVAVSMNLLARLTERDLKMISADRNVPDVLRVTARKKVVIDR